MPAEPSRGPLPELLNGLEVVSDYPKISFVEPLPAARGHERGPAAREHFAAAASLKRMDPAAVTTANTRWPDLPLSAVPDLAIE